MKSRFARMKTGHTPSRSVPEYWDACSIPWFTLADVWQLRDGTRSVVSETSEKISISGLRNSSAELLPAGTVIFSRTASIGFSAVMAEPMATSQDFWNWVCGPDLRPRFLLYVFRALQPYFVGLAHGSTHRTIYKEDAAALEIPVPPIEEQDAILRFLDRETAKIDALVAKQEQLMQRLFEHRAAVIDHTLTPPDSPFDVSRFSRVVKIRDGLVDPRRAPYMSMLLVAPNHIEKDTGQLLARESASDQGAESGKYLARKGDVLYSKIRPVLNKATLAPEDCLCSADMYALVPDGSALSQEFLLYAVL
jgi:hypothetical protein